MNKEEITYKIPNNQIHISEIKDEDCLIWISPKALNMANTIDELQQENQELKKQLEENKDKINWYENFENNKTIDKLRIKHNNQHKEFINYINDYIKLLKDKPDLVEEGQKDILEEILSKYQEIIGDDK